MRKDLLSKTLVIGVIALFVVVGFQPSFAYIMENHPPYTPNNYYPCGETEPIPPVINLSWDGGDPDPRDSVYYDVYFDDVNPPYNHVTVGPYPWNQTRIEYGPVELECYTTYCMKIDAYDNHGAYAFGKICCFTTGDNIPPCDPIIDGPLSGGINKEYEFTFISSDPDSEFLYYVKWGDGTEDITDYGNDTVVTLNHSWNTIGDKEIRAKAIDIHGAESHWSTWVISIKRNKQLSFNFNHLKWRFNHIPQVLQPVSIYTDEVKHETTVRIHRANRVTPYTLKLTEEESDEIDRIFDNIRVSLDSAETNEEIDEIYDDAVVSLYKLGLFPKSMTVEEAQQLVKGENRNPSVLNPSGNLIGVDENFDCRIAGEAIRTFMFDLGSPLLNKILERIRHSIFFYPWRPLNYPYFKGEIGFISFGKYFWSNSGYEHYYPSKGWVWTNGSNGVVKWNGSFRGGLGHIDVWSAPWGHGEGEYVYKGVKDFEGLWIDWYNNPPYFLGNAAHVKIV